MYAEFVKSAAFQSLGRSGSGGGTGPHAPPDESEEPALKKAATVPAPPPALACLHALRQICNHPLLLNTGGSRAAMAVEDSCKLLALRCKVCVCVFCSDDIFLLGRDLFTSFDIGSASAGGSRSRHKVLVFTQYSRMLDVIQSQLLEPHFSAAKFARIDGPCLWTCCVVVFATCPLCVQAE